MAANSGLVSSSVSRTILSWLFCTLVMLFMKTVFMSVIWGKSLVLNSAPLRQSLKLVFCIKFNSQVHTGIGLQYYHLSVVKTANRKVGFYSIHINVNKSGYRHLRTGSRKAIYFTIKIYKIAQKCLIMCTCIIFCEHKVN